MMNKNVCLFSIAFILMVNAQHGYSNQNTDDLRGEFMNELDFPYELFVATDDECEQVSDEIMNFNAKQVPFTTKPTPVFKRYVIKDNGVIVAGKPSCISVQRNCRCL